LGNEKIGQLKVDMVSVTLVLLIHIDQYNIALKKYLYIKIQRVRILYTDII